MEIWCFCLYLPQSEEGYLKYRTYLSLKEEAYIDFDFALWKSFEIASRTRSWKYFTLPLLKMLVSIPLSMQLVEGKLCCSKQEDVLREFRASCKHDMTNLEFQGVKDFSFYKLLFNIRRLISLMMHLALHFEDSHVADSAKNEHLTLNNYKETHVPLQYSPFPHTKRICCRNQWPWNGHAKASWKIQKNSYWHMLINQKDQITCKCLFYYYIFIVIIIFCYY